MSRFSDIGKLKELEAAATSGKWIKATRPEYDVDYETADHVVGGPTGRDEYDRDEGVFSVWTEETVCRPEFETDADFIAALRNASSWALEALAAFQHRDAIHINDIIHILLATGMIEQDTRICCLRRLQAAAEEMER